MLTSASNEVPTSISSCSGTNSGWLLKWLPTTNLASISSLTGSTVSFTTHNTSNRDKIGSVSSTFCWNGIVGLYLPRMGLAAATTAHRALKVVTIPALEIEIDCCSIASWIDVRSASFILSNSSMRQTPLSASTKAPPSRVHSRVTGSFRTLAVRPTADAP